MGTITSHRKAIIGNPKSSFWLYSSESGFDLTHPATPYSSAVSPRLTLTTTTTPITVHPPKTALVIIDMQNFFISPLLGRPKDSKGLKAQRQLLKYAIPAARKAGIRVIWLNWGLTQQEIDDMPPATLRAFGFETVAAEQFDTYEKIMEKEAAIDSHGVNEGADQIYEERQKTPKIETSGKDARIYKGLGSDVGRVTLDTGEVVPGGRLLMRDQWNSGLTAELDQAYQAGQSAAPPDAWIHKNRMSGLWGERTLCTDFLEQEGIKTLLFAGVNTDQCVGGSLQDAFTKGYDCILLSDGAATTSPPSSQESVEFNCAKTWGFAMTCQSLWEGASQMTE